MAEIRRSIVSTDGYIKCHIKDPVKCSELITSILDAQTEDMHSVGGRVDGQPIINITRQMIINGRGEQTDWAHVNINITQTYILP